MKLFLSLLLSALASQTVIAGNGVKGGDDACAEFAGLVGEIAEGLSQLGQPTVDKYSKRILISELNDAAGKLKCIPVSSLPRNLKAQTQGEVGPNGLIQITTELLWEHWLLLPRQSKVALTAHEVAVGLGYEPEGAYTISSKMVKIFSNTSTQLLMSRCSEVFYEQNGEVSCGNPGDGGYQWLSRSSKAGMCRRLGFSKFVRSSNKARVDEVTAAEIDESGAIKNRSTYLAPQINEGFSFFSIGAYAPKTISSITCRN